jgi:transposase IS200 family protein
VPKYRYRVVRGAIRQEVFDCLQIYNNRLGCQVVELNVQSDHAHLLITAPPKQSISDLIGLPWILTVRFYRPRGMPRDLLSDITKPEKGPLQLDLFEPLDLNYEYKVIVTNKTKSAKSVVLFHNGRGSQESIFGDAKTDTALGVIPCKRLSSNQVFTLASMMAHNFS